MHRKSPIKSFKILKLVSSQVLSRNFTGVYSNTQTRPRHLTSILTKITQPHKQTSVPSLSHACSAQHACVTQASPGQQKQRDLQAEPLRFTTLPVLCEPHLKFKTYQKSKADSNANVAKSILVMRVALLLSLISIY